ncbi:MAG: thiamine pyrophosphate-binding protein [Methylomonas sp.]|jgi:acetolactate synthase-1/2/3 large subunit|uniref:thiamine pyrophosphate-binding protein n=1 Tax=Methylomonas sp. TaxID=418 RepID=UPI0025DCEFE3|nr:thiamine pyrophosphate-binding protein [Methylomonas sp.]MCK9608064.1 thiamine pyrophosphate-binding protein [Methylomonas sp.]
MNALISLIHNQPELSGGNPEGKPPSPKDVADLLVEYLEQLEIEYVFGVPGGAIEPFYNAIARSTRRGRIRHILARHEAGAAFMADGYARESGKIGVCCSTSGPGATNLITGVACAYDNNIPMLVITGQPALPAFGKNPLQESSCTGINTLGMFRHCTRYNSLVSHPKQLEAKLVTALQRAVRAPKGPSHLTVPVDIFRSPSARHEPSYDLRNLLAPSSMVDNDAIEHLRDMLTTARNVVLLIGGLCGEAIGSILQFAALKGTVIVTTPDGKGLVNPRHPLFRGVFGFGGHNSAEAALRDASVDLILAIGANMGEWNSGGWSDSVLNNRLVHIDESEEHLSRTPMAKLHVRGRIQSIFSRLVEQLHNQQKSDNFEYARHRQSRDNNAAHWEPHLMLMEPEKYESDAVPIKPQRLMKELGLIFPPTTRFLADTGNSVSWSVHYLHSGIDRRMGERRLGGGGRKISPGQRKTDGGWLRVTMNFAAMGWAIGGAVGTAVANRKDPVVCITGDGSMLMNGQEISVAVAEKVSIVFVVLNDQSLGMVKHGQRMAGAEQIGCDLPPNDFAALARALGAVAHTIRSPEDLAKLDIPAICAYKGPTLLDVYIDPEEEPPMNVRMRVLVNTGDR